MSATQQLDAEPAKFRPMRRETQAPQPAPISDSELIARARDGNYVGMTRLLRTLGLPDSCMADVADRMARLVRDGVLTRHPARYGWVLNQGEMEL